jgi:hypothetical protein
VLFSITIGELTFAVTVPAEPLYTWSVFSGTVVLIPTKPPLVIINFWLRLDAPPAVVPVPKSTVNIHLQERLHLIYKNYIYLPNLKGSM